MKCLSICFLFLTVFSMGILYQAHGDSDIEGVDQDGCLQLSGRRLPDTGQTRCFNNFKQIKCPAQGEPFWGQDANYPRDVSQYFVGELEGKTIVEDRVTGLTWFRPESGAEDWATAQSLINSLNDADSQMSWRMPTVREIESLASYGSDPGMAFAVFNMAGDTCSWFWSDTSCSYPSSTMLAYSSSSNKIQNFDMITKLLVLAVSGPPMYGISRLRSGNGTVTDLETGIVFQADESGPMTWQEALHYCEHLEAAGLSDWKLPDIRELLSIVRFGKGSPFIDTNLFPGARPGSYWSSTTFEKSPNMAWVVDFSTGTPYQGGFKNRRYFVRCIEYSPNIQN